MVPGLLSQGPASFSNQPNPPPPRYMGGWAMIILGGILPFGSIFIEMYFIFTRQAPCFSLLHTSKCSCSVGSDSFWGYKFYFVWGFMLLVFLNLIGEHAVEWHGNGWAVCLQPSRSVCAL